LKRIAVACEKAKVRYGFKKLKSGFVVCFYRSENEEDSNKDVTVKSTDKVRISTDKVRINTDKLNSSQKKIVEFILKNGKITNKEVQQLLAVKDSRALKILKELVEMEIIVKKGKLKGSYYVIENFD
jgi:predicted HTH transcriptional regulator